MPLLSPRDTGFALSVARNKWHFKSRRLCKLLRVLVETQNTPSARNLARLQKRIDRWRDKNPKEVAARGTRLAELEGEVAAALAALNAPDLDVPEPPDPIDFGGDDIPVLTDAELKRRFPSLQQIQITDLPSGVPGQYTFTPENIHSEGDRNKALARLGPTKNPQDDLLYWLILGKLVTTPKLGSYYGRCFSCAAAVIKCLVSDEDFDDLVIEHVGSIAYDHHLIILGRENADGSTAWGLERQDHWGDALVIDVWQGNHSGTFQYLYEPREYDYTNGQKLRWFCSYDPAKRAEHRIYLAGLRELRASPLNARVMGQALAHKGDTSVGEAGAWVKDPLTGKWGPPT
ncbi:hypothetical protein [Stieleria mannarensis]|uniref:hypothetical protein n=1 Tax=Stieleria mannarensis TaxID=2755585 RepID=UPI0015FF7DD9|nr:hypothetical protein [Rhodopirellula sp. JC639]